MGYPMSAHLYYGQRGLFWASKLDLHVRIVKRLLEQGFAACYKVHPERASPTTEIKENLGAVVVDGKIEKTNLSGDFILITYSSTSALPFLLSTKKPIIFINSQTEDWKPSYLETLAKRVQLLKADIYDAGQIVFDESALPKIL